MKLTFWNDSISIKKFSLELFIEYFNRNFAQFFGMPIQEWIYCFFSFLYLFETRMTLSRKKSKKVFNLQMLYSASLFATAWLLTGSWIPGVLTSVYFTALGIDMTRISFTIPLRESFALPFWALQNAIITYFFKKESLKIYQNFHFRWLNIKRN